MSNKNRYNPPTISKTTVIEPEEHLLSASTDMDSMLLIEGQMTDGYYESDDIGAEWGWD